MVVVVPALWALVQGVFWPLWQRLGPVQVARHIESSLPGMHNRLVSCVDSGSYRGTATAIACPLSRPCAGNHRPDSQLSATKSDKLAACGNVCCCSAPAVLLPWLWLPSFCGAACPLPWPVCCSPSPTAAATVRYTVKPGAYEVLRGEDIPFTAQVERGDPERLVPELCGDSSSRLAIPGQGRERVMESHSQHF